MLLTKPAANKTRIESADDQVLKKLAKRTPLSFLSLDCNHLEEIPPAVGDFRQHQYLYFCASRASINWYKRTNTDAVGDFSQLHELRLSANGLKLIPPSSIARNCLLTTLWLQNNRLSCLPDDMGVTLSHLTSLFLNNNQVRLLSIIHIYIHTHTYLTYVHVYTYRYIKSLSTPDYC